MINPRGLCWLCAEEPKQPRMVLGWSSTSTGITQESVSLDGCCLVVLSLLLTSCSPILDHQREPIRVRLVCLFSAYNSPTGGCLTAETQPQNSLNQGRLMAAKQPQHRCVFMLKFCNKYRCLSAAKQTYMGRMCFWKSAYIMEFRCWFFSMFKGVWLLIFQHV